MEDTNESKPAPKAEKKTTRAKEKENALPPVPCNRVDDPTVRGTYRAKSYDLLQELTGGRRGVAGSSSIISLAQCFAEAVALPHDPTPTHKELEAFYEDVDADVDTASFFNGGWRRIKQYEGVAETTGNWRMHGVGDVGSLYFFAALVTSDFGHNGNEDRLRMDGFPPTPHGIVGARRLVAHSGHRIGPVPRTGLPTMPSSATDRSTWASNGWTLKRLLPPLSLVRFRSSTAPFPSCPASWFRGERRSRDGDTASTGYIPRLENVRYLLAEQE